MSLQLVSNTAAVKEVPSINLKPGAAAAQKDLLFAIFIHTSTDFPPRFWHLLLPNAAKVNSIKGCFFYTGIKTVYKKIN